MTKPLTKPKKREWKAWGVWHGRKFIGASAAKWLAQHNAEHTANGSIAPVTISLAKPKRRK